MKNFREPTPQYCGKSGSVWKSVRYAMDGLVYGLRDERNLRIHFAAAGALFLLELVIRPTLFVTVLSCIVCALVIAAELFNTSLEQLADLFTDKKFDSRVKALKDTAAAAVLVLSLGAAASFAFIVQETLPWHWYLFTTVHLEGALVSGGVLVILCIVVIQCGFRGSEV